MSSTTFSPTREQRAGMLPVHVQAADGQWQATDIDWSPEPEWWAGGHGLYSTPREYLQFQRMLLRGGELDGHQILQSSTVEAAFTNQIGELDFPPTITSADKSSTCDFNIGPGWKWGLGLLLNSEPAPGMRAAWSGAWAGIFNTHFWVDRSNRITGAIYSQFLPFVTPPAPVHGRFDPGGEQPSRGRSARPRRPRRTAGRFDAAPTAVGHRPGPPRPPRAVLAIGQVMALQHAPGLRDPTARSVRHAFVAVLSKVPDGSYALVS
jgi:CubicO group peptidase (beta-lactamase class C family)